MRWLVTIAVVTFAAAPALRAEEKPIDVPIASDKYRLIGRLHEPFGTVVMLQGVVGDAKGKGHDGEQYLRVQRINGRATQEGIGITLMSGFEHDAKLELGQTYELKGYETGKFVGLPRGAIEANTIGPQLPSFHFSTSFEFNRSERIHAIRWSPAEFVDRESLIEGHAISQDHKAFLVGDNWRLLVDATVPWPEGFEKKSVEALGTMRKTDFANTFRLEKGVARLVKLEDSLGREVVLRGTAWSTDGRWFLDYRGTNVYIDAIESLADSNIGLYGRPMVITGILDMANLPAVDRIGLMPSRDRKQYFIVRKASWKLIDSLLAPERIDH